GSGRDYNGADRPRRRRLSCLWSPLRPPPHRPSRLRRRRVPPWLGLRSPRPRLRPRPSAATPAMRGRASRPTSRTRTAPAVAATARGTSTKRSSGSWDLTSSGSTQTTTELAASPTEGASVGPGGLVPGALDDQCVFVAIRPEDLHRNPGPLKAPVVDCALARAVFAQNLSGLDVAYLVLTLGSSHSVIVAPHRHARHRERR